MQADSGYPRFQFLSQNQRHQIAGAALEILERIGMKTTEPDIVELLRQAGAQVDGDRVRLPSALVEEAIYSAPDCITIYTQKGEEALYLCGYNTYFGASVDGPTILDPRTGGYRKCLEKDIAWIARLVDRLSNIDFLMSAGFAADRDTKLAERVSFKQCLLNSSKPILAIAQRVKDLIDIHKMAAILAGGDEQLQQQPFLMHYAEPISPLVNPDASLQRVCYCAEHNIPLVYSPFLAMGATAPQRMAAAVAQGCAESLFGLVVHQLKRRGTPFIFGGMPSVMDMKTTIFSYGAPEFQLGNSLMAEMAHYFGLPNFGTAGTSDSQVFDGQAVLEATSSCMMAALSGANLIHDVGLLGNATVVMPEMIVATNEIIGMIRHLLCDVPVNDETLALNIISVIGPGGEFVTHPHTLRQFRDVWYPDLLYRGGTKKWNTSEQWTFEQRVNALTRELIKSHQTEPLSDDVVEQIEDIIRLGNKFTSGG